MRDAEQPISVALSPQNAAREVVPPDDGCTEEGALREYRPRHGRAHRLAGGTGAGGWSGLDKNLQAGFGLFALWWLQDSGLGRERGLHGSRSYQQQKSMFWSMSERFDGGFTIAK